MTSSAKTSCFFSKENAQQRAGLPMADECEADETNPYYGRYYSYIISIGFISIFQILLLLHTIFHEITLRNDTQFQKLKSLRILYIILQLLAISFSTFTTLRFTIDPHIYILRDTPFCGLISYAQFYPGILFYGIYLYMVLHRLKTAFKDTELALSRRAIYIVTTLIVIIPVVFSGSLLLDEAYDVCFKTWIPSDFPHELTYCTIPSDEMLVVKYHILIVSILMVIGLNIFFAVLFTKNLLKMLRMQRRHSANREDEENNMRQIVLRINVLTVIGCISTILGMCGVYVLFIVLWFSDVVLL